MEEQNFGQRFKHTSMKIIRRIFIYGTLILVLVLSYLYFGTYETGMWAGRVLGVSEKGIIFKTHEGKLSLESFGALKGVSPVAETRDFSVLSSQEEVLQQLQEVSLSGERVNLHFKKKYLSIPWRGDTKYLVERVERVAVK
jgi:hypothetical protein